MTKFIVIIAVLAVAFIGAAAYAVVQHGAVGDRNTKVSTLQSQVADMKAKAKDTAQTDALLKTAATDDRRQAYVDAITSNDALWVAAIVDYGNQLKAAGYGALAKNAYAWAKDAAYTADEIQSLADDYMNGASSSTF